MSLFPAYANQAESSKSEQQNWLENSSFEIDLTPTPLINEAPNNEFQPDLGKRKKKYKSKKTKKKKPENPLDPEPPNKPDSSNEDYILDTTRTKEFLNMKSLPRPPKYRPNYYINSSIKLLRNKRKFKRYYQRIFRYDDDKSNSDEEIITKSSINKITRNKDEHFTGFKQEGHLSETTASYNKKLASDPHDIKLWLDYIRFQDVVYQFEKSYRKGSIAKGLRVMAERKLSILDKALSYNSNCEELLRERLNIAVSVYPSDELQIQLKNLVDKEQGNIILWQGYIEAAQCSMSHCNTPSVLNLYTKCLSILHKIRRNVTIEKSLLEESILKMLYQCGLFLKQAGLFEQLWTLLKLYLELNLSSNDKSKFNIDSSFNDRQLFELEEVVFKSQLPLHELWLRTEKLRESCHWLPNATDDTCADPQRIVLTEDVAELIHPITMAENIFKLTATVWSLLKIPILPCRHCTMFDLGLDYVPWALDSIESLLPIFLPLYPIDLSNKNLIIDTRLAVGPQYLKVLPGQEEYLDFILNIMKNCIDCLKAGNDKTALTVWWLRFQRLLIILDSQNRFKLPQNCKKKIKSSMKNLLKEENNRNNILFYCEYALFEKDAGNLNNCIKILQTSLNFKTNKIIYALSKSIEQSSYCYLYRTMVEICLNGPECDKNLALRHLITFALERNELIPSTTQLIDESNMKFKHITSQLTQNQLNKKLSVSEQFIPNFATDWIICHGWFLYLTQGPLVCGAFIEDILQETDGNWQKEVLFEFYVAVIYKHCIENPGFGIFKILDDILYRAIESYANNIFFLTVLAKEQSLVKSGGQQWWKMKGLLLKSGRALPILFLVLIAHQQISDFQETVIDTLTGNKFEINSSLKNRMLALFRHITRSDMCTRRCGLIWRLYLQFVHAYFDPSLCRNVYYIAVEECPWLKALYIDAAIYIPAELAQIQDLIIEKQLRLHVTPEELDVLRN